MEVPQGAGIGVTLRRDLVDKLAQKSAYLPG